MKNSWTRILHSTMKIHLSKRKSTIKFLTPNISGYNKHYLVNFHTLLCTSSDVHLVVLVELGTLWDDAWLEASPVYIMFVSQYEYMIWIYCLVTNTLHNAHTTYWNTEHYIICIMLKSYIKHINDKPPSTQTYNMVIYSSCL